jgi:hypothetical protein
MNLKPLVEVKHPASADEITQWRDGYAWLAGGTWLFSDTSRDRHADRSRPPPLAGAGGLSRRIDHRRGALNWVDS